MYKCRHRFHHMYHHGMFGHPHIMYRGFKIFKAAAVMSRMVGAGAFMSGLFAIGTFVIGRAAIGLLFVKKAKVEDLDINDLHIHRMRVDKKL